MVSYERVDPAQWEEVDPVELALDEPVPPSIWQRMQQRPLLTGAALLGAVTLIFSVVWLVAYLKRPPKCVEYQDIDCSAIVLERTVQFRVPSGEDDTASRSTTLNLNYPQAEVLDWLRLLAISRRPDGTLPIKALIDSASADLSRAPACFEVANCQAIPSTADIDYDGISGQVGVTTSGQVRTVSLASNAMASPVYTTWGRIAIEPASLVTATAVFDEIHLITNSKELRPDLLEVAAQFRAELLDADIAIRVRVFPEANSRSSSIAAARVIIAPSATSLRADGSEVFLELQSVKREVVWRASYSASIEHVIDAARRRILSNQKSVIIVDCQQHQVTESANSIAFGGDVEVMCYGSPRFEEFSAASSRDVKWMLISSQREAEIVGALVPAIEALPLLVLRL